MVGDKIKYQFNLNPNWKIQFDKTKERNFHEYLFIKKEMKNKIR